MNEWTNRPVGGKPNQTPLRMPRDMPAESPARSWVGRDLTAAELRQAGHEEAANTITVPRVLAELLPRVENRGLSGSELKKTERFHEDRR
jgi:hypothetical protein